METSLFLIIFAALFILIAAAAVHSHLDSRKKRAQRIEELKRLSLKPG
jgi:hypothetical protein